jgi:hypothetical protein
VVELEDHFGDKGNISHCVFCNREVKKIYIIRDPTMAEQRMLALQTKTTL